MAALASQKAAPAAKAAGAQGKSGLIVLEAGQDLFREDDLADCLFIIQKGQIRLYRPKGKGFIELAMLRAGEVLGEMAYFDDGTDGRRSCSASAITKTEVIAISFAAFGKAIENLNPWFKTIISTLADRLRKTNAKVKELESNSVSVSGGASAVYEFLKDAEVSKIMSMLYLVAKALGEKVAGKGEVILNKKMYAYYVSEIFAQSETKWEEFLQFLQESKLIELRADQDNVPNIIFIPDVEKIKLMFTFVNAQRAMKEEKKFSIGPKCESFMDNIIKQMKEKKQTETQITKTPTVKVELGTILSYYKERNIAIDINDLEDARRGRLLGEISLGDNQSYIVEVNTALLDTTWECIKFSNALKKWNERKSSK